MSASALLSQRGPPNTRVEATLDVVEASVQHWADPSSAERLFGWHAALFPTGRSGITPIVVGGWRIHPEPMQIVTPRLGRPDVVHYQAPDSGDVPAHIARLIDWFNNPAQDLRSGQRLFSLSRQMSLDWAGYYRKLQAATSQSVLDVTPGCAGLWAVWNFRPASARC